MQGIGPFCDFQEDVKMEVNSLKSSVSLEGATVTKLGRHLWVTTANAVNTFETKRNTSHMIINLDTRLNLVEEHPREEDFMEIRTMVKGRAP